MMKSIVPVTLLALVLVASGCVVRTVYPWLSDDTKVSDISLVGTWHDGNEDETAFFTSGSETNYNILLVSDKKEQSKFTASLHRVDKTLLLVVGPEARSDMGTMTTLPAYFLFRVELRENIMKLYDLDVESFGDRVKNQKLRQLEEGDEKKGYILLCTTKELNSFIESQINSKTLFSAEPMYTFTKLKED